MLRDGILNCHRQNRIRVENFRILNGPPKNTPRRVLLIGRCCIYVIIMLSVNFFCNISSYDILAYITKNYIALIYYAKIVHLLCQFHAGKVGVSAVSCYIELVHVQGGGSNLSIYHSRLLFMLLFFNTCYWC